MSWKSDCVLNYSAIYIYVGLSAVAYGSVRVYYRKKELKMLAEASTKEASK